MRTYNTVVARTQNRIAQLDDALLILRLYGVRPAADYLYKLGWSLQQARWTLLGK